MLRKALYHFVVIILHVNNSFFRFRVYSEESHVLVKITLGQFPPPLIKKNYIQKDVFF